MQISRRCKALALVIFCLSVGLRLGMVSFNRESNDDHMQVINFILKSGTLPDKSNCWECYQPKLFHYTAAKVLQLTGADRLDQSNMILAVELINFFAGLVTLAVAWAVVARLPVKSETLKLLSFGLVALNPKLIGINSQATNDTFATLFSTLALSCTILFLQKQKLWTFLLVFLFSLLAIASKANGWVITIAIALSLFIKAWVQKGHATRLVLAGSLFLAGTLGLSIVNPLTQYITNTQKYGSPTQLNLEMQPLSKFFEKTTGSFRPGILSIQDGFFTFKIADLLQHPRIENDGQYARSRTSLWTQLYGRAYSIHFDNWPASWSTNDDQDFTLTRAIFILAFLPTLLLLFGALLEIGLLLKSIFKRDIELARSTHYGLFAAAFSGAILFIILYSLLYRDFSVMKAIFIYPALVAFPLLFIRAAEFIDTHLKDRLRWLRTAFTVWIVTLFALYAADVITMIQLLYSRRMGF